MAALLTPKSKSWLIFSLWTLVEKEADTNNLLLLHAGHRQVFETSDKKTSRALTRAWPGSQPNAIDRGGGGV